MSELTGIILSAGFSRRMKAFKPLVLYRGLPFLLQILQKLAPVCRELRVVTGYRSEELQSQTRQLLLQLAEENRPGNRWLEVRKKIRFIYNPQYPFGMFSSLKAGISQLSPDSAILYHQVDQPHIPDAFYAELARQYQPEIDWLQPVFQGIPGHPVILGARVLDAVRKAAPNANLRQIKIENHFHILNFETGYQQILSDFDFPNDLREEATNEDL
ncbi:MAG: NTP transferase domain-containing protein [Calditrichia bacterium]